MGIFVCERHCTEHLLKHVPRQSDTNCDQCAGDRRQILWPERAVLEQSACNSFCQYCEAGSGWERQTGSDLIGARLCCRECNSIVGMHTGCNARHDDRRDCDRGNAQRQFVEPIGIVEPRHRRRRNRGNCGCCYQLQLRDAGGDQARQSTLEKRFRLTRRVRVRALPSATGRKPDRRRQNQLQIDPAILTENASQAVV